MMQFSSTTVDLVIFASLDFRKFLILGLLTKYIIRKLPVSISMMGSAIIVTISRNS